MHAIQFYYRVYNMGPGIFLIYGFLGLDLPKGKFKVPLKAIAIYRCPIFLPAYPRYLPLICLSLVHACLIPFSKSLLLSCPWIQNNNLRHTALSSIASGGAECPIDSEKFAKNQEKEGKIREKEGKNWEKREKIREKRENWEEKAELGKVLSLCSS